MASFISRLKRKRIDWLWVDAGDQRAGSICVIDRASNDKAFTTYRICANLNHTPPVQFATLAHELGHLFLGHLGTDKKLEIKGRSHIKHDQKELEAESLAYLVWARNGVASKSETYLANYVTNNTTIEHIDIYQVLHAAHQVETLLDLAAHAKFDRPHTTY